MCLQKQHTFSHSRKAMSSSRRCSSSNRVKVGSSWGLWKQKICEKIWLVRIFNLSFMRNAAYVEHFLWLQPARLDGFSKPTPNKKEWKDDRVQWDFQSLPPVRLKGILERLHTEYRLHFASRRWERKCKTMISLPDILSYCWILLTVMFCFGGCISWHVVADNWYLFACIC